PMLPTAWAAAVTAGLGGLRADLAAGRRVGAVALGGIVEARGGERGGALWLTGSTGPVLGGGLADVVVIPVALAGEERWALVEGSAAAVTRLAGVGGAPGAGGGGARWCSSRWLWGGRRAGPWSRCRPPP